MLLLRRPDLSVVVVAYGMGRELPRTLLSLSRTYQDCGARWDVLVVDNGSPIPVRTGDVRAVDRAFRVHRIDDAHPSPVQAVNAGVAMTAGRNVAVIVDGARMVTPGAIRRSLQGLTLHPRPVVTLPAWHLGHEHQSVSIRNGYGPDVEDALLDGIGWPRDGHRLFEVASLAGSNPDGPLGNINESCFLTVPRALWDEAGGMDEAFDLPGGGYANLDLWTRLVELPDARPVVVLGEGSFHQVHGGASTNSAVNAGPWAEQYARIRGKGYTRPRIDPLYVGALPELARRWVRT